MGLEGRGVEAGVDGAVLSLLRVLAIDPDRRTLATALARGLFAEWAPEQVSVYLLDPSGEALVAVASFGDDPTEPDYSRLPLDIAIPVTQVFRSGEERSLTMVQAAAEFPMVAGWIAQQPYAATAEGFILPLAAGGRTVGILSLMFRTSVDRSWRFRAALDAAVAALSVWSLSAAHQVAEAPRRRAVSPTPRQRQVLELIAMGRTNAEIAEELGVSVGTVKADLAYLFRLFDVRDRQALVHAASLALPALDGQLAGKLDGQLDGQFDGSA